ncbi:MAG: DUF4038 domain-containing protein, partial [Myxococcota bacterium]
MKAGFALLLLCIALPAHAKPALVQRRDVEITAGGSASIAFKKANSAGNLIVAYVVWDNGGAVSVTDTEGNVYVSAVGPTQADGDPTSAQVFYAKNVAGGSNTVTATFDSAIATHAALYVFEYKGLSHTAPFDTAVATSGSSLAMTGGPLTTHSTSELLFMGAESNGGSIAHLTRGYRARAHRAGELAADGFAPDVGDYAVSAAQTGSAWVVQLVAFNYSGRAPASPQYPAKVGPGGRYLVDQNGAAFLITGDSPQSLFVNLSERQAASFFADRQKKGFNTLWINLLCGTYTGGREDASTFDGITPFSNGLDFSTPNEAYFSRIDDMIRLAAQRGITVLLNP